MLDLIERFARLQLIWKLGKWRQRLHFHLQAQIEIVTLEVLYYETLSFPAALQAYFFILVLDHLDRVLVHQKLPH